MKRTEEVQEPETHSDPFQEEVEKLLKPMLEELILTILQELEARGVHIPWDTSGEAA